MILDAPPPIICPAYAEACSAETGGCADVRTRGDLEILEAQAAAEPDNADAWVRLGFARMADGDRGGARQAFERALAIAPAYDDARLGLAQLAYRTGDVVATQRWLAGIDAARRESDPEIVALSRALADAREADVAWRADVSASYSALSDDLDPWREATVSLARRSGDLWIGGGLELVERFGESDLYGEARLTQVASHGAWSVALGGADEPLFKPEAQARLEYATPEDRRWRFAGALSLAEYQVGPINRLSILASRAAGDALRVSVRGVTVKDELDDIRFGYGAGVAWNFSGGAGLELAWSDAPESSDGATVDVQSLALIGAVALTPSLRLRAAISRERRDAFDRTEFTLALARTF